jgi:hypothetical protein
VRLESELAGRGEYESLGPGDRRVNFLKDGDGEGGRLSGAGLGLSDNIAALEDRDDGSLLDGGRPFETGSSGVREILVNVK